MTYSEWCHEMERRYDTMPQWYWDKVKCRAAYENDMLEIRSVTTLKNDSED